MWLSSEAPSAPVATASVQLPEPVTLDTMSEEMLARAFTHAFIVLVVTSGPCVSKLELGK